MSIWDRIKKAFKAPKEGAKKRKKKKKEPFFQALPAQIQEAAAAILTVFERFEIEPEIVFCYNAWGWPLAPGGLLTSKGTGVFEVIVTISPVEEGTIDSTIEILEAGKPLGSWAGRGRCLVSSVQDSVDRWRGMLEE